MPTYENQSVRERLKLDSLGRERSGVYKKKLSKPNDITPFLISLTKRRKTVILNMIRTKKEFKESMHKINYMAWI